MFAILFSRLLIVLVNNYLLICHNFSTVTIRIKLIFRMFNNWNVNNTVIIEVFEKPSTLEQTSFSLMLSLIVRRRKITT